jgi:membrane fusion protein (multidrug efflux system)
MGYESSEFLGQRENTVLLEEKKDIEEKGSGEHLLARKRGFFPGLILVLVLVLALGGATWWFYMRGRVSTDDAYVMAHTASISSRIDGTVSEVLVDNDDHVSEGQVLVQLDPRDYQVAVDRVQAVVARMEADIKSEEMNIDLIERDTQGQVQVADAALREAKKQEQIKAQDMAQLEKTRLAAQADLTYARREFNRYEALYRQGSSSKEQRDNALTLFRKAEANLKGVEDEIAASKAALEASRQNTDQAIANLEIARSDLKKVAIELHRLDSLRAQKKEAQAELEEADLQLSYCTIKAPISGHIAQRSVQVGDRVQTGQPIMAVVPLHAVYVEANFKETQLERVRPGQPASIEADIYPGYVYDGRVSGIGAGTGAAFSLLPPQNATGNWIKIVQRVPVKIELNQPIPSDYPLRVGLSLNVTIDVRKPETGLPKEMAE